MGLLPEERPAPCRRVQRLWGSHPRPPLGHSISIVQRSRGGSDGGKPNTNHTIVRGGVHWDNEKNDSPFLVVVISKDEPTAPAGEGMGSAQPDAPFPGLRPLFLVRRGGGEVSS